MKVWNTINMSGGCIATELQALYPDNRKWAGIYPLAVDDKRGSYKYVEVELPKRIIENDLDWFNDDEIKEEVFLKSLEDLYKLLDDKNINPLSFDVPWKFNYPYHY